MSVSSYKAFLCESHSYRNTSLIVLGHRRRHLKKENSFLSFVHFLRPESWFSLLQLWILLDNNHNASSKTRTLPYMFGNRYKLCMQPLWPSLPISGHQTFIIKTEILERVHTLWVQKHNHALSASMLLKSPLPPHTSAPPTGCC